MQQKRLNNDYHNHRQPKIRAEHSTAIPKVARTGQPPLRRPPDHQQHEDCKPAKPRDDINIDIALWRATLITSGNHYK